MSDRFHNRARAYQARRDKVRDRLRAEAQNWGERFEYTGFHGHIAHCLVKRKGNVVICTEHPENDGTSITNTAETLATEVCRHFGIALDKLIWIEHYIHEPDAQVIGINDDGHTFDLIEFKVAGDRLAHPKWGHLYRTRAEAILDSGSL
jgi:hypothetical protein